MTLRAITNDGSWITVRVDVQNINGCGYDEVEIGSKGGPTLLNASYCNLTITFEGPGKFFSMERFQKAWHD
uniref:Uncharacterized protein n=1 Tax=Acrobeloides nanus TaxID=290746 RepID=A0A914D6F0_9BILA